MTWLWTHFASLPYAILCYELILVFQSHGSFCFYFPSWPYFITLPIGFISGSSSIWILLKYHPLWEVLLDHSVSFSTLPLLSCHNTLFSPEHNICNLFLLACFHWNTISTRMVMLLSDSVQCPHYLEKTQTRDEYSTPAICRKHGWATQMESLINSALNRGEFLEENGGVC